MKVSWLERDKEKKKIDRNSRSVQMPSSVGMVPSSLFEAYNKIKINEEMHDKRKKEYWWMGSVGGI